MTLTLRNFLVVLFVLIFMSNTSSVFGKDGGYTEDDLGIFSGTILQQDGKPFMGSVVFFSSDGLAPMDFGSTRRSPKMVAFTDAEGKFTTNMMPAGSYFIGALKRQGWRGGPPQRDEKRYSAFDEKDEYIIVSLKGGETKEIGSVAVKEPKEFPELKEFYTIQGRLLDDKGKGVFGAVVVVKKDYNELQAVFISDQSSIDGSYQIKLPPGKFFLLARETVAGSTRPKPGSSYGELGQDQPVGLGGKTSKRPSYIIGTDGQEYKDVNIIMFTVPIPEVKRAETEAKVKANKMSKESLPENLPMMKSKTTDAVESSIKPVEPSEK